MSRSSLQIVAVLLLASSCRTPARVLTAPVVRPASPAATEAPTVLPSSPVAARGPAPDPTRFQQDVLLEGVLDEPTEIAVASDGRVFMAERGGTLELYDPQRRAARAVAGMPLVGHEYENGLIGVTLDPSFDRTGWLYLNYTPITGDRHRLSRFTFANDTLREEKKMLEVRIDAGCCHTGGSLAFDGAGNLFVSYGDNTNPFTAGDYAPIDPTPGKSLADALRSSGNTNDLRGKILRITPKPDGTYAIPAGNLFATAAEGRPEIYTMGHRNPYRISVDSRSGFLYWGEIGPDARADSVYGSRGFDEVNQARRAGNFGWPMFVGDNRPYRNYNFTTGELHDLFDPARPVNPSPNNTGAKILPPAQPAMIWYPYETTARFPLVGEGGRSAMAGPVYHYADFAGSAVRLPEYYDGKFLHYDWMRGWMMAVTLAPNGDYAGMEPFLGHLKFDHPSDVELGRDGSLYVVEYGTYWSVKNRNARLSRITYHPDNRPPVARIDVTPGVGAAPLATVLSAEGSFDRDANDSLRYLWSIAGAGEREGARISHTFTTPGTHHVRLRVRDRAGAESEATADVRVGNSPPKVAITVRGNRSFYWDRPALDYTVQVTDAEDASGGRQIDPRRVSVTMAHDANGLAHIRKSDCLGCHGVDQASVGPAYLRVAQKYAPRPNAAQYLAGKIAAGSAGVWGERVMPPHPALAPEVRLAMAEYILSLAAVPAKLPMRGRIALDRRAAASGGTYRLVASYADQSRNGLGPLADTAAVVLRSSTFLSSEAIDLGRIALRAGPASDSSVRPFATAYEDSAFLALGRLDLTGVAQVAVDVRSQRSLHPYTLELRADGVGGPLLGRVDVVPTVAEQWSRRAIPVTAAGERALFLVLRSRAPGLGQFNPLVQIDGIHFER